MKKRAGVLVVAVALLCLLRAGAVGAATSPLLQIGESGQGAGQLDYPYGVAIGPNGDIYVAEVANARISQFSASGTFIRAWGADVVPGNANTAFEVCTAATGCKAAGSGAANSSVAGAVRSPEGLAVASNGDVFSLDGFNGRIDHFTAGGEFVNAFGLDVVATNVYTGFEICTFVTTCQQGDFGSAAGTLGNSRGLAIGAGNQLYALQSNLGRISELAPAGEFDKAWGYDVVAGPPAQVEVCTVLTGCQAGATGNGAGQFNGAAGIAVAGDGNVVVAGNGRVDEFTPTGEFVRAFGFGVDTGAAALEVCTTVSGCQASVQGGAAGQLSSIQGIEVAEDGTIYVADLGGRRVVAYSRSGGFDRAFGFDVDPGGGEGFEVCRAATGCKSGVPGSGLGQLTEVRHIAADCRGAVWVTDSGNDRITRFGEPGTPAPPCLPDQFANPGTATPASTPNNKFRLGKARLNRKKGTAKLPVTVPGPGTVQALGKLIRKATLTAPRAGYFVLSVKARGKAKRVLKENGKSRVELTVTFTPTGGEPNVMTANVTLRRRLAAQR
jgi:NHL repeat-containing protein